MKKLEPRDSRGAALEDRLLSAAARLFRERGFDGTSVRDIAKEAGILLGSLHYRYNTKDALLLALMNRAIDTAIASVRQAADGISDPLDRVRRGLRAHLSLLLSGDDAVFALLYEWRSLQGQAREEMIRLRDRYESFWDEMIQQAAGAGCLRSGIDLKLMRLMGFGATNWAAQWYRAGGQFTPEQVADTFFDLMGFGVLSEEYRLTHPEGKSRSSSIPSARRRNGQARKTPSARHKRDGG